MGGGGGVTVGWLSAHGGFPRCPVVASSALRGQSIALAQRCRAWPGEVPAPRRRPRRGARWCLSQSQASRTSAWTPEASIRVRACSCSRAICACSGGTAASLSSWCRLVALKPPVTDCRQRCCCCHSKASPIQCRWAGQRTVFSTLLSSPITNSGIHCIVLLFSNLLVGVSVFS